MTSASVGVNRYSCLTESTTPRSRCHNVAEEDHRYRSQYPAAPSPNRRGTHLATGPTVVGQPLECRFLISNFDTGHNPEQIFSLSDTVNSFNGPVPSGNLLASLELVFAPATGPLAPTCIGGSGAGTDASRLPDTP